MSGAPQHRQPGLSSRLPLVQSHQLVQTAAAAATSGPTPGPDAAAGAKPSAGANGRDRGPDPGRNRSGCYAGGLHSGYCNVMGKRDKTKKAETEDWPCDR